MMIQKFQNICLQKIFPCLCNKMELQLLHQLQALSNPYKLLCSAGCDCTIAWCTNGAKCDIMQSFTDFILSCLDNCIQCLK